MIDPLLNSRAAELLAIPAGEPGVFLDREEAALVLEALAEVVEVKKRLGMPLVIHSSPELDDALKDLHASSMFVPSETTRMGVVHFDVETKKPINANCAHGRPANWCCGKPA